MKNKLLAVIICFFTIITTSVMAIEPLDQLKKQKEEIINKLTQIRQQKNTLSSQIQYMDTQIYLTQLNIQETETNIETTQKEIDLLGDRIDNLDSSLNQLTELLRFRVVEEYKEKPVSVLTMIIDSATANDFITHFKYLKTAQENNQRLIVQVQQQKLNFEEQKVKREEKKKELDQLIVTLDQQKSNLKDQQGAKRNLLVITNNDENKYHQLLLQIEEQLQSYASYTQSIGGGLTTFGKGSNGWYYTQRDPAWGNLNIGNTSYTVLWSGCAITSVAMVCTSYGNNITPFMLAVDSNNFNNYAELLNNQFSCSGKSTSFIYNPSLDQIKDLVKNQNVPVILKLSVPTGTHFIVVWKWDDGANDFIMHDPYNGPDMKFSSIYSWSQVLVATVIR